MINKKILDEIENSKKVAYIEGPIKINSIKEIIDFYQKPETSLLLAYSTYSLSALKKKDENVYIDWYSYKKNRVINVEIDGNIIKCSKDILNFSIAVKKAFEKRNIKLAIFDISTHLEYFGEEVLLDYLCKITNIFKEKFIPFIFFSKKKIKSRKIRELFDITYSSDILFI